jgi:hypothetical protein
MMKPFNLQTNQSTLLAKKRLVNNNTDELNNKIAERNKGKAGETTKRPTTPSRIRFISKSPCKSPSAIDDELISLSNRIERYCVISKRNDRSKSKSKSPLKLCFSNNPEHDKEANFNNNIKAILNETFINTTSIRKQFDTEKLLPTDEKILLNTNSNKFKAKPLNQKMFAKKQPEIKNFEDIMEKTRMETKQIEKCQKIIKKNEKITNIKKTRFNKENICNNIGDLMLIEK